MKEKFHISGMTCSACSAHVEKAVNGLQGVQSASVSLLSNSMIVVFDEQVLSADEIVQAVERAGYGASLKDGSPTPAPASGEDPLADRETPALLRRLCWSVGFCALLMYVSMGHVMWGWPLPAALAENPMALGLTQMLLAAVVLVINQKFFIGGAKGLLRLSPNMDTLVALGSGASFLYSAAVLFMMSADLTAGDVAAAHHRLHGLYFESAAMILALITVGKTLEARAKGKTTNALRSLMSLTPDTATVLREGAEVILPASEVRRGDRFIVKPAQNAS